MNRQTELIEAVTSLLASVPNFGALVIEDSVYRVLDSEDSDLPDSFIVLQPGATSEVERIGSNSVREQHTLNITLVTRQRTFAGPIREGRYWVKRMLSGRRAGLSAQLVQEAGFQTEQPMPPEPGRTFAAHVMPLQITYIQQFA